MDRFGEGFGRGFEHDFQPPWIPGFRGHGAWWTVSEILPLVLLIVLIGVVVWAAVRVTRRDRVPVGAAVAGDGALTEVRLRYARGDMNRDEYLEKSHDLGGTIPLPEQPPPGNE
jgi:uncharacterized membrane protein